MQRMVLRRPGFAVAEIIPLRGKSFLIHQPHPDNFPVTSHEHFGA